MSETTNERYEGWLRGLAAVATDGVISEFPNEVHSAWVAIEEPLRAKLRSRCVDHVVEALREALEGSV